MSHRRFLWSQLCPCGAHDGEIGGRRDRDEPLPDRLDELAGARGDTRNGDAPYEDCAADAVVDDVGHPPIKTIEEEFEAGQDARLDVRIRRQRSKATDGVRALGCGNVPFADPTTKVAQLLLDEGVGC